MVSLISGCLLIWGLLPRSSSVLARAVRRFAPTALWGRFSALALLPLFSLQLALVVAESRFESSTSRHAWMKTLPIPVFDYRDTMPAHGTAFAGLHFGIGLLETLALAVVVCAVRRDAHALSNRMLAAIVSVFIVVSLADPVLATTDPYEYAATGILGFGSYESRAGSLSGTAYGAFDHLIALNGVIYGPLWVFVDMLQTSFGSSIAQKIEAIRVTNVVFLGVFICLLRRAGFSKAALVGCAINPFIWFFTVANPHADIQGLVFLAAAYGFARRSQTAATVVCVVAAGLIKLPFAIVGAAALTPLCGSVRRFGAWSTALLFAFALSYLIPGPAYFAVLAQFAKHRAAETWPPGWLVISGLVAGASFMLVGQGRAYFGAAWLFQQMAVRVLPWYLCWGVPYALATGTIEIYAVSLPLAAALLSEGPPIEAASETVYIVIFVCLAFDSYLSIRRRRQVALRV